MLLVLRHGPSEWNASPSRCQGQFDVSLSEAGRALARLRGARLTLPDAAWASHLSRAIETAQLLLEHSPNGIGRPLPTVSVDHRLAEADCGDWQGQLHDDLRRRWPKEWNALRSNASNFAFPGGDSLGRVLDRFSTSLNELDERHADEAALVVAHGGPMRLFLAARGLVSSTEPGAVPGNLEGFTLARRKIELVGFA